MLRISIRGHRPAFMKQATTATSAAQPPAEAQVVSLEKVQMVNLGFFKLKIYWPDSGMEPARRKQAQHIEEKAEPRPFSNGFRGVRLNGQVQVTPIAQLPQEHHEAVECRHFATEFDQHPGKKAELMKLLSERKGIEAKFDGRLGKMETSYQTIIREAPQGCKHVVSSDHLGSYLTALAATLHEGPDGPKEASCLLLTHNHAMALHVGRKRKAGVDCFSAKLYDPNDAANYKRVVGPNPEALGPLTLKDMLITPGHIRHYAGEGNTSLSMVAVSLNHDLQPKMNTSATTHSAQNLHMALSCGVHTELQAMLQTLPQKPDELFKLLQAKTSAATEPGAFTALQDGRTESIKIFIEAVLNSNLSDNEKAELLAAKSSDGTTGLYFALQNGHKETVKAFTQAVSNSNLGELVKAKLLEPVASQATLTNGQ